MDAQKVQNPTEHKYQCAVCPYSAKFLKDYKLHLAVHSSEKPFKCPECSFRAKKEGNVKEHVTNVHLLRASSEIPRPFPRLHSRCTYAAKTRSKLKDHSKIHSDAEPEFFCTHLNCNYSTDQKRCLISHTRVHTGEKPFVCQFESCSYASAFRMSLLGHTRIHTKERPFKCLQPNCQFSAAHSSHLKTHQLTHSPKEGEERPSFSCPLCEYLGKSKSNLSEHIKRHTHEKFFKCGEPNCTFEAKTKTEVESHKNVHSDEKPFACPVESCGYRCKQKSNLTSHLKSHSEERRYKCELCPFRGKTRSYVVQHLKQVHSDPDFRPFKCKEPKCNHAYKTKTSLNQHLLIHKGDKKYSCPFPDCDFKSVFQGNLKKHQNVMHKMKK